MALRGRLLVGSRPLSRDLVSRFVASAAESGIDIFRIHDPLNDLANLQDAAEAIHAAKKELTVGLVHSPGPSGDTDILPPRYGYTTFFSGNYIPTDLYFSDLDGNWNADGDSLFGEGFADSVTAPGDKVRRNPASVFSTCATAVARRSFTRAWVISAKRRSMICCADPSQKSWPSFFS